jgi:molecular chaperone GrpE (heat shock protein)
MNKPGGQPDLAVLLQALVREYVSFQTSCLQILDSIDAYQRDASGAEAERLSRLQRQAYGVLLQHGVRPTARVGAMLDLQLHHVVRVVPAPGRQPDEIVGVERMGYELVATDGSSRVLRHAQVVVAAPVIGVAPPKGGTADG